MKFLKSTISLVLALIMVFSCCSVSLAAADTKEEYPMVYLAGFGDTNIYYEDDPEQKSLFFPLDTERILGNLGNIGKYITDSIKQGNYDLLYSCLYNFLWDSFGMLRLNPDGSSVDGVVAAEPKLNHVGDNRYDFNYDCRLDPIDIAYQLHDYIDEVKEATGSEKVELVTSSYSANAVLAYLSVYENQLHDLDSVVFCVPSIGGISIISELLAGEFNVSHKVLKDYVGNVDGLEFLGDLLDLLDEAGLLEILVDAMLVPVLKEAIFDALTDICRDLIATIPAAWACVTDEYFHKAMVNMFGENYASKDHKFAPHIKEVTDFHRNIKLEAETIITDARDNYKDMHIAFVCKYGKPSIPLSKYEDILTDGVVFIELSSFGATCANYGEKFPEGYKQAMYPEYNLVSPDGLIDASTCLFPLNTWFIKGLDHAEKNEDYHKVLAAVAHGDLNVFTDENYPQYVMVSPDDPQRIVPFRFVEEEQTLYDKVIDFFKKVISFVKNIFINILGK